MFGCLCAGVWCSLTPKVTSGFFVAAMDDRDFMRQALRLAEKGRGTTSPNPMVGAVVVSRGGRVIATGYHRRPGTPHAEVVALQKAGRSARGGTLYVTLEPCCHTGRTGPCVEVIARAGIERVVFASRDPDPRVNGKGARWLRRAGIAVQSGVLDREQRALNEAYYTYHRTGRPLVLVKVAQSLDGRVATRSGESRWLTGLPARRLVHRWRTELDAVVVGAGTVRADNPALTVRHLRGRNPYRIVLSQSGGLPRRARIFTQNDDERTIVVTSREGAHRLGARLRRRLPLLWVVRRNRHGGLDLRAFLERAADFGLRSLLLEGGPTLSSSFLRAGLVDKVAMFIAPVLLGDGLPVFTGLGVTRLNRAVRLNRPTVERVGVDMLSMGYPGRTG